MHDCKKKSTITTAVWVIVIGVSLLFSIAAPADQVTPVGTWKTIDDKTGKPLSYVKIWEWKGAYYGKITKLIDPDEPNPLCDKCSGKKHNKPVIGMQIMWGLKKGDEGWWDDGYIMDPDNGKTYRCKMRLAAGGKNLDVRGYLGISLLGRTQTWNRLR